MDGSQLPALIGLQFFIAPAAYFVWAGAVAFVEARREIATHQNAFGWGRMREIRVATMREKASWLVWIWIGMNVVLFVLVGG